MVPSITTSRKHELAPTNAYNIILEQFIFLIKRTNVLTHKFVKH